jgi:hypothetical protein
MGVYSDYLNKKWDFQTLAAERKTQLSRISSLRNGRGVLVYAADLTKNGRDVPLMIDYSDLLPVQDQLSAITGDEVDIIIETPGGIAEVAEDMVRIIRSKFARVGMIVPGWAKSAGTILVMAGDEILMGPSSSLGPIDPQINFGGKRFSADAFLDGFEKIKTEVQKTGKLNPAYIPILQNISPGEIQNCENARTFSQRLVKDWLASYKFKYWTNHSDGRPVTPDEKKQRADEIAKELCDHSQWLTHGRSVKLDDLRKGNLRLKIVDYSENPDLNDAISRYYTLLRMSFDATNIFKVIETATSQIYRFITAQVPAPPPQKQSIADVAAIGFQCPNCKNSFNIQVNLGQPSALLPGNVPYPIGSDLFKCPSCGTESNLSPIRLQIEAQSGKKAVA